MKITDVEGNIIDLNTGEVTQGDIPTFRSQEAPKLDEDFDASRTFFYQPTWAINSMLFALPDTAVSGVMKSLGYEDQDIPSLTKFFNRGQDLPKNRSERYSAAIGESLGTMLPYSGILGWFAGSYKKADQAMDVVKSVPQFRFLGQKITPRRGDKQAPVVLNKRGERVPGAEIKESGNIMAAAAQDALEYTRKNPFAAAGLDLAFGIGYGGLTQTIDETLDEGTLKDYAQATLPVTSIPLFMGTVGLTNALVGLAGKFTLAGSITKQVLESRAKANGTTIEEEAALAGLSSDKMKEIMEDPLTKELIDERKIGIPGLKQAQAFMNNLMGKSASKDINKAFEFLTIQANKDESFSEAFAMDELNKLLKFIDDHPNLQGTKEGETIKDKIQFSFDLAQSSLSAEINNTKKAFESKLPNKFLRLEQGKQARNIEALLEMYKRLSPKARKEYIEAVNITRTQHELMMRELSEKAGTLGEAELKRIAEKNGGQTIDDIGDSL